MPSNLRHNRPAFVPTTTSNSKTLTEAEISVYDARTAIARALRHLEARRMSSPVALRAEVAQLLRDAERLLFDVRAARSAASMLEDSEAKTAPTAKPPPSSSGAQRKPLFHGVTWRCLGCGKTTAFVPACADTNGRCECGGQWARS